MTNHELIFSQSEDGRFLYRHGGRDYKLTEEQAIVASQHSHIYVVAFIWGLFCVCVAAVYATFTSSNADQAGPVADIALFAVVLATAVLVIYPVEMVRRVRKQNAFLRGCDSLAVPPAKGPINRWRQWAAYQDSRPIYRRFPTWSLVVICGVSIVWSIPWFVELTAAPSHRAFINALVEGVFYGIGFVGLVVVSVLYANLLLARVYLRHWAK